MVRFGVLCVRFVFIDRFSDILGERWYEYLISNVFRIVCIELGICWLFCLVGVMMFWLQLIENDVFLFSVSFMLKFRLMMLLVFMLFRNCCELFIRFRFMFLCLKLCRQLMLLKNMVGFVGNSYVSFGCIVKKFELVGCCRGRLVFVVLFMQCVM